MRRICVLAVVGVALVFAGQTGLGGDKAEKSDAKFFNGKDLTGWEGLLEYWKVEDGAIVGAAPKGLKFNTFLCSKEKYKDFELQFKVKMTKGGNSGVQIRSKIINEKTFAVGGPQCDIGQVYWGALYGEHYDQKTGKIGGGGGMMKAVPKEVIAKIVKEGDWNDYYIKCVGNRVTIKLNGETTVDQDFNLPEDGIIAWQLHSGAPMEAVFAEIRFKNLSAEKK